MHKPIIPVFFSADDNYVPCLSVAIASLTANADKNYFYKIHILNEGLAEKHIKTLSSFASANSEIVFVNVEESVKRFGRALHLRDYYTKATYYRFFIPKLFPEYGKCIYFDSDMLILGDVSKLYSVPLGENLVAAVPDDAVAANDVFKRYVAAVIGVDYKNYFNAGLLVMNLNAMRTIWLEKMLAILLTEKQFPVAQDQDYLNLICNRRVVYLDGSWNRTAFAGTAEEEGTNIVHFKMSFKPWRYKNIPYGEAFWHYAEMTPFASSFREKLDAFCESDAEKDKLCAESLFALCEEEIKKVDKDKKEVRF